MIDNFKSQLIKFNEKKIKEAKGTATLSDAEFSRVLIHLDNRPVYESAKTLRDKYVLTLDNGETVYLDFFSHDIDRNIYQVAHQITMDTEMIDKYMVIKTTEPVLMVMRPYQIYAVKAAKKRILEANQNGYVFACTGDGGIIVPSQAKTA